MSAVLRRQIRAHAFNASTSEINFGSTLPLAFASDRAQTWIILVYPKAAGEGNAGYIVSRVPSSSTNGFRIGHDATNTRFFMSFSSSGSPGLPQATTTTGTASTYHRWYWFAGTREGGTSATSNLGVFQAMHPNPLRADGGGFSGGGTGTLSSNTSDALVIGNRAGNDRTFNGDIALVLNWDRVLTIEEMWRVQFQHPLAVRRGLEFAWIEGKDYGPYRLRPTTVTAAPFTSVSPARIALPTPSWRRADAAAAAANAAWIPANQAIAGGAIVA